MDEFKKEAIEAMALLARDPQTSTKKRQQALYAVASFQNHKNGFRLMAQYFAVNKGEKLLYSAYPVDSPALKPAKRHDNLLLAITSDFRVAPTIADLEGRPIDLFNMVDPAVENAMGDHVKFAFHKLLLAMEKRANADLEKCVQKYGYHWVFRAGIRQYYLTKCIVEEINFWRPDPRGNEFRVNAQKLCYAAMELGLNLTPAEQRVLVLATSSAPDDAYRFWNWLSRNRVAYNAMKICISLLEKLN